MLLRLLVASFLQEPPPAPPADAPAQPPAVEAKAPANVVDLRINVPLNRPLLVDVKRVFEGRFDVTVLGKKSTLPMVMVDDWRFIDVHTIVKDDEEVCARQYLKTFTTHDGQVDDCEMNGLRVDLTREKEEWTLATADERVMYKDNLDKILEQAPATSLWISLPKELPLDAPFEVELVHLLRTAMDEGKSLEASPAKLRIESVDAEKKTARLVGSVSCAFTETRSFGTMRMECELAVLLVIDQSDWRMKQVRLEGTAKATSQGLMDLSGGGKVTIELQSTVGEAATAAMREKPKYRQVERRIAKAGVEFTAPSYWFKSDEDLEGQVVARSLSDESGIARLYVSRTREKFDAAALLAELRKLNPGAKVEMSSNPLGKSVRFALESEGFKIVGDLCALDAANTLTFKLISPPSLFDDSLKEFEAMRRTLKRIKKE